MRILVDGDMILYRPAFTAEEKRYDIYHIDNREVPIASKKTIKRAKEWVDETLGSQEGIIYVDEYRDFGARTAIDNYRTFVHSIRRHILDRYNLEKENYNAIYYLTSNRNYRTGVQRNRTYKISRKDTRTPANLQVLKDEMMNTLGVEMHVGLEADDLIAINAGLGGECIVVSSDKDLDQISGQHYNPVRKEFYYVTREQAEKFLWKQMLTGDVADEIKGIKGIGEKKADKFLKGTDYTKWGVDVYNKYKEHFGEEDGKRLFTENYHLLSLCKSWEQAHARVEKWKTWE